MECTACGKTLTERTVDEITVDVCENGCGGIWFDNYELEKVDEKHEAAGEALLDIARDPAVTVDYTAVRYCPKCPDVRMVKHFVSVKKEIEIDECPACGGIWLDSGELAGIRNQFETDEQRKQAAEKLFDDVFGVGLEKMRSESEENLKKARKVAHAVRFICPSYYLDGDQEWGAF
mgnify:CR=1 FL=1